MLLSKCDLLPVLDDFRPENARQHMRELASSAPVFELSSKNGSGMDQWLHWLLAEIATLEHRSGALYTATETGTLAAGPVTP
jgi:hydrogenase nickel incorporation protein HypB